MQKTGNTKKILKNTHQLLSGKLNNETGQFNVFKLEPFIGKNAKSVPYRRRDYYKITLVKGNSIFHYADKSVLVKEQALAFSNPQIPYSWEQRDKITSGFFCIFTKDFFHQFGNVDQYAIFQPQGTHIFELPSKELKTAATIFEKMLFEINSDYAFRYDIIRNAVYDLIHLAMKLHPATNYEQKTINASQRITSLFLELLERQFPKEELNQKMDFAVCFRFCKSIINSRQSFKQSRKGNYRKNYYASYRSTNFTRSQSFT